MKGQQISVNTSAVIIAGANAGGTGAGPGSVAYPTGALIKSATGNGTIWFGGQTVTSTTGFPLAAGEALEVDLVNEILYAVATTTVSATLYVLRRGD